VDLLHELGQFRVAHARIDADSRDADSISELGGDDFAHVIDLLVVVRGASQSNVNPLEGFEGQPRVIESGSIDCAAMASARQNFLAD
jgi:hypothetical protein